MKQLCVRCLFIGTGRHGLFSGNVYVAIAQVSLGIALIAVNIDFGNLGGLDWEKSLILAISLLSILVGILNFRDYTKPGRICPKCATPGMLVIESPEGQRFIRENNIKIPEQAMK